MRFTLKYSGTDLLSAGNANRRKREKQILRQHCHKQLVRIWDDDNVLRHVERRSLQRPIKIKDRYGFPRPLKVRHGRPPIWGFLFRELIHGAAFIPLITGPMEASCHLALRVGRPAVPGGIVFGGGDLDGRLKTLFDALSVPKDAGAIDAKDVTQGEYICLLSDDELLFARSRSRVWPADSLFLRKLTIPHRSSP